MTAHLENPQGIAFRGKGDEASFDLNVGREAGQPGAGVGADGPRAFQPNLVQRPVAHRPVVKHIGQEAGQQVMVDFLGRQ